MSNKYTDPARCEISVADTWDLESMYAKVADWETAFAEIEEMIPKIVAFKGKLSENAETLLAALKLRDKIQLLFDNVYIYAHMRLHEDDMNVALNQSLSSRAKTLYIEVSSAISFMDPELLEANEFRIEEFLKKDNQTGAELLVYRKQLDDLNRQRTHVLSADIEELLDEVCAIAETPKNVFERLINADIRMPVINDENGKDVQLSEANIGHFLRNENRDVRKLAFSSRLSAYSVVRHTLAANYAGHVKQNIFFARARRYGSSLEAALDPDGIPTCIYSNLLSTIKSNLPKLHRYLALRKRLLGLPTLGMSDLFVAIVKDVDYRISYTEARNNCLEALAPLGNDYVETLRKGFASGWVDVCENKGKCPGAYSWGSYSSAPFVLLHWQDNMENLFTLIHECGHSMHSNYTRKTQPYCYGRPTYFVAEVASICNEMLLADYLLKTSNDKALQMYTINKVLDSFHNLLFRQTLLSEFELEVHSRAEADDALSTELLCSIYKGLNQKYYGTVVNLEEQSEIAWARIPHLYNSFHVYKYATGLAAAVSISQQIIAEGESAAQRYLSFLCGGSSKNSLELLKGAGVDLSSPAPVQQALDLFESYIDRFEMLLTE